MTPDQAKELLPVFTAYSEGKTVQWASQETEYWADYVYNQCGSHQPCIFLNPRFRWRVKPEPREWWLCQKCRTFYGRKNIPCQDQLIHVREVLK